MEDVVFARSGYFGSEGINKLIELMGDLPSQLSCAVLGWSFYEALFDGRCPFCPE
jgi:hypothetical protein